VNLLSGKFYATEHALVASQHQAFAAEWLYYAFDDLKLNRFSIGQAQPGLSVGVLNNVPIAVPHNIEEQQRIASCLSSLDDLITAETQKLEALKTHKRGLMQQMFPSPEEA
jgi:type I restriction enzyme S subunit